MGKGGGDLCVELKVHSSLVPQGASSPNETSYHGDTDAFGYMEERLIRMHGAWSMLGVEAREGDTTWDPSTGLGRVAHHKGDYHDAIQTKRNTVDLRIHNTFGGFNRRVDTPFLSILPYFLSILYSMYSHSYFTCTSRTPRCTPHMTCTLAVLHVLHVVLRKYTPSTDRVQCTLLGSMRVHAISNRVHGAF